MRKNYPESSQDNFFHVFHSIFGRIENSKNCFQELLTFSLQVLVSSKYQHLAFRSVLLSSKKSLIKMQFTTSFKELCFSAPKTAIIHKKSKWENSKGALTYTYDVRFLGRWYLCFKLDMLERILSQNKIKMIT